MATVTKYDRDGIGPLIVDYLTAAAVAVDEIVVAGTLGNISVGVAKSAAAASGETISIDIGGAYVFPKVSAAAIKAGETVDWDDSAGEVDDNQATSASSDVANFGVALADAAATTTSVIVQLLPGNSTVT